MSISEEENDTSTLLPLCYTPNKRNTAEQDQQVGKSFPIDVTQACSRKNCKLTSAVSYERNLAGSPEKLFSLELKLPASPSDSPNDKEAKGAPVSDFPSFQADSGTSRDMYTWNLAKCDLPHSRSLNDEEKLLWPLQEKFSIENGQFKKGKQYNIIEQVGFGAFGECFVASTEDESEGFLFCIKKCQYRRNELLALELAKRERIKEIVDYYGAKPSGRNAYIFMEFMAGGTITELVERQKASYRDAQEMTVWPIIPENDCFYYLEDTLKALEFLHSKGIVHRDIKGDNLLLDEHCIHAKLTDFGSATNIKEAGGWSDDVWKTGCLLLRMLNGERSSLFGVKDGGIQRQNSCKPEDVFPPEAKQETRELLDLLFGVGREHLPSVVQIFQKARVFPVAQYLEQSREATPPREEAGN
ncbi:serine/threonine-protein kinase PAK 3-like [Montipora capricornis]|uniref:serine/threonine-protein kinase PAK 3-like n=1 Tax=Montipora capricornis TaxID=246305 RepID=UPI0035F216D5